MTKPLMRLAGLRFGVPITTIRAATAVVPALRSLRANELSGKLRTGLITKRSHPTLQDNAQRSSIKTVCRPTAPIHFETRGFFD